MIRLIKSLSLPRSIAKEIAKLYHDGYHKRMDCSNCKSFSPRLPVSNHPTDEQESFEVIFNHNDSRIDEFRRLYADYITFERPSQRMRVGENNYTTHLFKLTDLPAKR